MTGRRRAEAPSSQGPVSAVAFSLALMALANIAELAVIYSLMDGAIPAAALLIAVLGQFAAGAAATVAWMWAR